MEKLRMGVEEGAEYIGVRPSTMRSWILKKRIPYLKIGRRVLLRRADLDALLDRSLVKRNDLNDVCQLNSKGRAPQISQREKGSC